MIATGTSDQSTIALTPRWVDYFYGGISPDLLSASWFSILITCTDFSVYYNYYSADRDPHPGLTGGRVDCLSRPRKFLSAGASDGGPGGNPAAERQVAGRAVPGAVGGAKPQRNARSDGFTTQGRGF